MTEEVRYKDRDEYVSGPELKNYEDLEKFLGTLTAEQKKQSIGIQGDERFAKIASAMVLECDYVNPSGECIEPLDYYLQLPKGHDDYIEGIEDEAVVCPKGTVFLAEDDLPIADRVRALKSGHIPFHYYDPNAALVKLATYLEENYADEIRRDDLAVDKVIELLERQRNELLQFKSES